jgi:hypothetical protein
VNTGVLDVLTDSVDKNVSVGSNSVAVDLLGAVDELSDDDWVVGRDVGSSKKLLLQLILTADDSHGST